jgi:hypothetical protein
LSRNVFIFGAGASVSSGVPVLNNFLRSANQLRSSRDLCSEDQQLFDLVFSARQQLTAAHSKSRLNLDNFEELHGAFEMAALVGKLGDLKRDEVRRLPLAMRRLISLTIEHSMGFQIRQDGDKIFPPQAYNEFLKGIELEIQGNQVALLTFNYDLGLDYALYHNRIKYNYGFSDSSGVDLLKLHGSLNWGRCSKSTCRAIEVWELKDYLHTHPWKFLTSNTARLEVGSHFVSKTHCHPETFEPDPVLVPPTWNKGSYHQELDAVWSRAAQHLADAENIYIVGYSFPDTDQFFKYFFAIGSVGSGWIERVRIFDPDPDGAVSKRFEALLGPQCLSKFKAIKAKFEDVAGSITHQT